MAAEFRPRRPKLVSIKHAGKGVAIHLLLLEKHRDAKPILVAPCLERIGDEVFGAKNANSDIVELDLHGLIESFRVQRLATGRN